VFDAELCERLCRNKPPEKARAVSNRTTGNSLNKDNSRTQERLRKDLEAEVVQLATQQLEARLRLPRAAGLTKLMPKLLRSKAGCSSGSTFPWCQRIHLMLPRYHLWTRWRLLSVCSTRNCFSLAPRKGFRKPLHEQRRPGHGIRD